MGKPLTNTELFIAGVFTQDSLRTQQARLDAGDSGEAVYLPLLSCTFGSCNTEEWREFVRRQPVPVEFEDFSKRMSSYKPSQTTCLQVK